MIGTKQDAISVNSKLAEMRMEASAVQYLLGVASTGERHPEWQELMDHAEREGCPPSRCAECLERKLKKLVGEIRELERLQKVLAAHLMAWYS